MKLQILNSTKKDSKILCPYTPHGYYTPTLQSCCQAFLMFRFSLRSVFGSRINYLRHEQMTTYLRPVMPLHTTIDHNDISSPKAHCEIDSMFFLAFSGNPAVSSFHVRLFTSAKKDSKNNTDETMVNLITN